MSNKIKGYVPKTFKDSGTGRRFAGGQEHEFTPDEYTNYRAAGKIKDKPAPAKSAPADPKASPAA